jgi:hypothetical protein
VAVRMAILFLMVADTFSERDSSHAAD